MVCPEKRGHSGAVWGKSRGLASASGLQAPGGRAPCEKMPADEPTDTEQQGGSEDCRDRDGPAEGPPRGWQEGLGGRTPKLLSEGAAAIHQRLLGSQQELEPRVAQSSDLS